MNNGRLFEILYLLMEGETVTASALARRLEVSPRTIYRDVEALSGAGIPIYMTKGRGNPAFTGFCAGEIPVFPSGTG